MSSQPGPLQPTSISTLNTPPLASASPSNRHYPTSHPSPTRDGYASQFNSNSSPAPSSRLPSRRPSANDNSPMSSRTALASPVSVPAGSVPSDQNTSTSDRKRNMATAVPPRTSSSHHHSNGGSSSRRATQTAERAATSPRRGHGESREVNGGMDAAAYDEPAAQGSRSRRANQAAQESSQRSSSARESSRTQGASYSSARSPPATANSSKAPSREASEILNSIVISQPEEDIERERERLEMAQPHHHMNNHDDEDDAVPPPIVAPIDHGEEPRRGGRSRHDHSKREKHTKFGEYILGNTIGEGEFGKVKLGWKQEGGVQVGFACSSLRGDGMCANCCCSRSPSSLSRGTKSAATRPGWPRLCARWGF